MPIDARSILEDFFYSHSNFINIAKTPTATDQKQENDRSDNNRHQALRAPDIAIRDAIKFIKFMRKRNRNLQLFKLRNIF